MAKTVFVDGDPSLGVQGTVVDAAFLNAVQNHRHDGQDADGSAPLDYAADTGAADAYVIAPAPALAAHIAGLPIHFKATNTNTGASTININGLGAVAIKLLDGNDLSYGHLRKNGIYTIAYTGSVYVLLNPSDHVGKLAFELSNTARPGYLKINGALLTRTTYADLWAWAQANTTIVTDANWTAQDWGTFSSGDGATTFRLPEFRGEFPRFFDDGRGVDTGRVLGRYQADNFKLHTHGITCYRSGASGLGVPLSGAWDNTNTDVSSTDNVGGTETRPRNITLVPYIKF